mgnify:CR=1 FL=1
MKSVILLSVVWLAVLSGCSASFQTATISNDLYQVHSRTEIAERQKAEAEVRKAEAEAAKAEAAFRKAEADRNRLKPLYDDRLISQGEWLADSS